MNSLCTKQFFNYHRVMLKTKKRYILPVLGLIKFLKFVKNVTKNVARLICKSLFDITITFSDIPYKCSHVVEIENLKIFDFNHFSKS
jgi:hypothetical protein